MSEIFSVDGFYGLRFPAGDWAEVVYGMRQAFGQSASGTVVIQPFAGAGDVFAFFDFATALAAMKAGHAVSRRAWHIAMAGSGGSPSLLLKDGALTARSRNGTPTRLAYLLPDDLVATDWEVVK